MNVFFKQTQHGQTQSQCALFVYIVISYTVNSDAQRDSPEMKDVLLMCAALKSYNEH